MIPTSQHHDRIRHVLRLMALITIAMSYQAVTAASAQPTVITLTQTGCQFLEPEGKDHQYRTGSAKDCNAINKKTGSDRLSTVAPLVLKPGNHIFRVTNKNVPYELGFYLRGTGLSRWTLPKTSGGGLTTGKTQEYVINLKEGAYVYSCPLNPTPDYPVIVKP